MQIDDRFYDVVIVGAGPAGLSSAIYMARAKYKVLVLEKKEIGGQIIITSEIVNYPGVKKTSGKELTEQMRKQAEFFGAEFAIAEVMDMELSKEVKVLHTTKGDYRALGVILALGANPRKLGFKGEKELQGRGVAYCATCDGEFFTGKEVFVIGGGFAAVEEGIFLTKYARKVTLIVREEDFTCAKTVSDKIAHMENMEVFFETELVEAGGEYTVTYAKFCNNRTGEEWIHEAEEGFGIFVFAGYVPNTAWITEAVEKDEQGYLLTDRNQKTNLEGVYAAGDVCVKNLRQVVTAVSDGALAATSLEREVEQMHSKMKIPELVVEKETAERTIPEQTKATSFFSKEVLAQMESVFSKFGHPVLIKAYLDNTPLSSEIIGFLRELTSVTEKIVYQRQEGEEERKLPCMELCYADGKGSGVCFHGVPGGHEFNSFMVALYNVAGPGQAIEKAQEEIIKNVNKKINIKILVSLSCTMCPETVMSAQKTAALSPFIEAEMFDLSHFPEFKEKYKVMSVPCMIINDEKVYFGRKSISEMTEIIALI